jgi:hypothetical protein
MSASGNVSVIAFKDKLVVTIFSSYDDGALKKISRLKECMVRKGYARCKIVADYPYPRQRQNENMDQFFLRKSIYWLERSDACIFVFLKGFDNGGVAIELKHACDHLPDKVETSLVVIESTCYKISTSLIRGTIANLADQKKLNRRFFKDEIQLCKFCSSASLSFLKKLILYLIDRHGSP